MDGGVGGQSLFRAAAVVCGYRVTQGSCGSLVVLLLGCGSLVVLLLGCGSLAEDGGGGY